MTVHCDIVSAEGEIFSGLVEMVIAHGNWVILVSLMATRR
jgi:F0F1-type ATP synthase epsilon subunit